MSPSHEDVKSRADVESVVVVDGTNTLYRAFFAIPGLRSPDGRPTNAVLGFVKLVSNLAKREILDKYEKY